MNHPEPPAEQLTPYLDIVRVAKSFGVSVQTIRRRVRNGEFPPPAWRDGTIHRWSQRQIVAYRAQLEAEAEARWRAGAAAPLAVHPGEPERTAEPPAA
jgi:predicted DNA-binding transcriptional regulator AlpA